MADDQVVTNIVARADFSNLIANVHKVTASLAAMQQQMGASNKVLSSQINAVNRSFGETLRSTGQFSTQFVSLTSDVDTFGKRLDGGKLKLRDYFSTLQTHTRTSGGLIRDLARQQVQLQNAIIQPLGRNAQGLEQFNVHIPRGLDEIANKGALARQEMQILNKTMQQGAGQLINWGKNTQWAGRQLTVGLTLPIMAFGAASAKAFKEADAELVRLTKVYGGVAATSAAELAKVRSDVQKTASELSKAYGSSYKDTIALAADIAATGKMGNDLLKSTQETTRLAILGEVDRQDAMKTTLALQTAFRQNTEELAESINFLNSVENQTSTTLQDLTIAIPKAGPIIKGLGGDVEELALFLVAMKEGGVNATEGANALKSALASIINPTKVAKDMFQNMGISLEGIVNGNAGDVKGMIFELQDALEMLDPLKKQQAIEQLFGKFQFARMAALFENLGKQGSQTLQVMDLMKASSAELAAVADRELKQVTESASGKYRRAVEGLKADLAGIGEEFLKIATFFINLVDGVVNFVNKLPGPIKSILTFLAGLTAVTGPLIMLTGVLANFLGYVIKGAFHLKSLFRGGEGFKLLTPEILAANQAGSLIEKTFYSDAKAALALADALQVLSAGMTSIQSKMSQNVVSVQPMLSTVAGSVIKGPNDDGPGGGGIARVVDPKNPLVGPQGTRASAHMVPRSGMTQEQRAAQTIHSFVPAPIPVNQAIGATPQIFASGDLPSVPGLTTIAGKSGPVSTGVVSSEAAKWHTMVGTLSMMTKQEVAQMRTQLSTTGAVSSEFTQAFGSLLPQMTSIAENAAQQSAIIVSEAKAGKISIDLAKQRIIALNIEVERLMAMATTGTATAFGRTAVLTGVPTLDQPVIDPRTGKSNMRELFKKGKTKSFVDDLARLMGVKTWGGGYSTHTTIPIRRNMGGKVYNPDVHGNVVPGDTSINYDNTPAVLREGGFILNQSSSRINPDLVEMAKNSKNAGGKIVPALLTPGETYFPPEIAERMMPTLERANSGSVIKLLNAGGILGGRVSNQKLNYGIRLSSTGRSLVNKTTIENLWRRISGKKTEYEPKGTAGAYGGDVSNRSTTMTRSGINTAMDTGLGVDPKTLLASIMSRQSRSRLSTDVLLRGLKDAGVISRAEEARLSRLIFTEYASRIKSMPLVNDRNNPIYSISDSVIQRELGSLRNGSEVFDFWREFSRQPGSFSDPSSRGSSNYLTSLTVGGRTIKLQKLKGSSAAETFFHSKTLEDPMYAQLAAMHSAQSFNSGGEIGGRVVRGRRNYGVPSLSAAVLARIMAKWKPVNPYAPRVQKYDWTNTDPLHGPLFIGRQDVGSEGVRRSISYRLPKNEFGKGDDLIGLSPMMSSDPRYLIERYMQGDKTVMARMQEEGRKGLNPHPLSIQSLFRLVAKPFRGKLYRGMTHQSVSDTFPKHIVEAIEKARETGDFSSLIGRDFIMRRASFTASPFIASYFAPGRSTGPMSSLLMEARLFGRKVTPTSEMFPDIKFEAPYRQNWSTNREPLRRRSEQESLVGGKFTIIGFDGKKLIVEGRAMGGPVSGATPYVVGERGPELFVPKNSGGIIPNYALGGIVKGGKINYGELPPGWAQSLAQPTLAAQMRASGDLSTGQVPQNANQVPQNTGSLPKGFGIGSMALRMGLGTGGFMLGQKVSGGNMMIGMLFSLLGDVAASGLLNKLSSGMTGLGKASQVAGTQTSLLHKAFSFLMKMPGPLKLLAVVVGVGLAIKAVNDRVNEHKRIVSAGFGVSEESAKKLGLSYTKLGSQIDDYRKKLDLANAAAAANRYASSMQGGPGIDITVPQFEKLKKKTKKDFATEISMFDTANEEEAIERATNLKAAYVATGMSVEDANELIYAMLENSNKANISLKILGDSGFSSLDTKAKAAERTFKTFADVITKGDMDQLPIALQTASDAFSELQRSMINTKDDSKELVTSGEAYERVLQKVLNNNELNNEIGRDGLFQILKQNESLKGVISSSDTFAGVLAKIKLSTSGIVFDLQNMSSATAAALSIVLEKQKDFLLAADGPFSDLVNKINRIGKISSDQIIKNANITKESIQKEIDLRQKNIQKIKDEADAKKKALDSEMASEDFITEVKKKQVEYAEALASGDMSSAAQLQLDIQSMTGRRQVDLAKAAIDNKADRDIKAEQKKIDALSDRMTSLEKNLQKSIDAADKAQKQSADLQGLLDELGILIIGAQDGMDDAEKDRAALLSKRLKAAGFGALANQYLMPAIAPGSGYASSALGPGMVATPNMDYSGVMSLANKSLKFATSGGLIVTDPEVRAVLEAMRKGQMYGPSTKVAVSTDNFPGLGKLSTVKSNALQAEGIAVRPGTVFVDRNGNPYRVGQPLPSQYQSDSNPDNKIYRVEGLAMGGMIKNFMPGGNVKGPGTGTSDSIPAMLSNGEYVIKADSVKKYGVETFDALNTQKFKDGGQVAAGTLPSAKPIKQLAGFQNFLKKAYDNFIFPAALSADRLLSSQTDSMPFASTNQKRLKELNEKALKHGIKSIALETLGTTALDATLLAMGSGPVITGTGRSLIEAFGRTKGLQGLGSLLQQGSIPYLTGASSLFAKNAAVAAAIGLGKPFAENKMTSFRAPGQKISTEVGIRSQKGVMADWIEHKGIKIPTYSGGPFGEKRIIYQGAGDDFSELLERGQIDRVIPTTAQGILEFIVSQKPGDKKLAAMLERLKSGKRPGKAEAEFLKKMLAVSSFGPKTFGASDEIVSQLPKVYLDKIKSDNLDMGVATFPSAQFSQLPEKTQDVLKALQLEMDERYAKLRESMGEAAAEYPRVRPEQFEIGLLSTPKPEGFTTLISSMLGDKAATDQVTARLKMLSPYLNQIKEVYEKSFAERKAAGYLGTDGTPVDTSQIPMIRSAKFGYDKDEFGNIIEESAGFNIYQHLFNPTGNTRMASARARGTQHWTMWDVVRAGHAHMGSSWSDTEPLIISSLQNLLKTSDFESYGTFDAWRFANFLKPHKVTKGSFSEVQGYATKKQYVEELMKLGLYKDGDPLKLMYTDPATKRVLYQIKQKYTNSDLDEIMRLASEDRYMPNIKKVKSSDRDINDHQKGEGVFVDADRKPGYEYPSDYYSVQRIQRMLAIRQGQHQIGIDTPYHQLAPGQNTNEAATDLINRLALMTGTDVGGLHMYTPSAKLEHSSAESNPFMTLIQSGGTKTTDSAMSALLMHTYFGKFPSNAYPAHWTQTESSRISKLVGSWVNHTAAYKRGETKTPPISEAELKKQIKAIKDGRDDYEEDAEGGYISPENHLLRLKKQGRNIPKFAMGGMIKNFMPGGKVNGPGTGTSDSIPAMLSNGEYVIKADSVKKYGVEAFEALNAGKFAGGGYANSSSLITPSVPYYMQDGGLLQGDGKLGDRLGRGIKNKWNSYFNQFGKNTESVDKAPGTRKYTEGILRGIFRNIPLTSQFQKVPGFKSVENFAYDSVGKPIEEILAGSGTKSDYFWTALNFVPGAALTKPASLGLKALKNPARIATAKIMETAARTKATLPLLKTFNPFKYSDEALQNAKSGPIGVFDNTVLFPKLLNKLMDAGALGKTSAKTIYEEVVSKLNDAATGSLRGLGGIPSIPYVGRSPIGQGNDIIINTPRQLSSAMFKAESPRINSLLRSLKLLVSPYRKPTYSGGTSDGPATGSVLKLGRPGSIKAYYNRLIGSANSFLKPNSDSPAFWAEGHGVNMPDMVKRAGELHPHASIETLLHELGHRDLDLFGNIGEIGKYVGRFIPKYEPNASGIHESYADLFQHRAIRSLLQSGKGIASGLSSRWEQGMAYGAKHSASISSKEFRTALIANLREAVARGLNRRDYQNNADWFASHAAFGKIFEPEAFSLQSDMMGTMARVFRSRGLTSGLSRLKYKEGIEKLALDLGMDITEKSAKVSKAVKPNKLLSTLSKMPPIGVPLDQLNQSLDKFDLNQFLEGLDQVHQFFDIPDDSFIYSNPLKFNNKMDLGNVGVPKFEKGINMVPANMLAMLHKNEAVVPANMNPFNPNAQSYSQPSISYNIAPVINAAPGMDEQAIANMATRQVLAEIKAIDSRNIASMGRPGMRVVGNK